MKIRIEAAIDLDSNRKVWIQGDAENVEPEQVPAVSQALCTSVTTEALQAYAVAAKSLGIVAPSAESILAAVGSRGGLAPSERKPRPDDPVTMRTFGEDDEDAS